MTDEITFLVRFRVNPASRPLLEENLKSLFDVIRREESLVSAVLHQDTEDPEQLLVYEVWRESRILPTRSSGQTVSHGLRTDAPRPECRTDSPMAAACRQMVTASRDGAVPGFRESGFGDSS